MVDNLYTPSWPLTYREYQNLVDRVNYLTTEVDRMRGDTPGLMTTRAEKESPIPGIINLPWRDAGGQDGAIRVSKDGVIVSYVNPLESPFPYVDVTAAGNIGAGADTLHTYTLDTNILAFNGDMLKIEYIGGFATNDNNKRLEIQFDAQSIFNTGSFDFDGAGANGQWTMSLNIVRVTPTSIRSSIRALLGQVVADGAAAVTGSNAVHTGRNVLTTVSNLNTTAVVINVIGEATANDDVTQNLSVIEFFRPRTVKLV